MSRRSREELTPVPKVYEDEGKKLLSGDIWTHFNSSTPRTNNRCEGYNRRLYRRVVISHPNINEMITILMQEHVNKAAFLIQLEAVHCLHKKSKFNRFVDQFIR